MNVGIRNKTTKFHFWEYINGIFGTVCTTVMWSILVTVSYELWYMYMMIIVGAGMFGGRREAILSWAKAYYSVLQRLAIITIFAPMIYTAPYIMFWMCAYPLRVFWAPNGTRLSARCHFTGPKKISDSRAQPPPTSPSNGYARIQNIMHKAV
jgi:hypothetical protein